MNLNTLLALLIRSERTLFAGMASKGFRQFHLTYYYYYVVVRKRCFLETCDEGAATAFETGLTINPSH